MSTAAAVELRLQLLNLAYHLRNTTLIAIERHTLLVEYPVTKFFVQDIADLSQVTTEIELIANKLS